MADTQPRTIQQLTTATEYGDNDFLVISNNLTGNDRKIVKENFVNSIGNPTIDGYTSVSEEVNRYTLTPASGQPVSQYYNGMTISFIADADSTGAVQVRISGVLPYKNLLKLGTATTSTISQDSYYEAVYIGNNATGQFYQTNVQAESLPTVTGYTSSSTSVNEITLTPANGIPLQAYYDGMVVEFVSPINNTGLPKLKINNLTPKNFYKFGHVATEAPFIDGDHYRAIYIQADDAFYQTNLQEATIFTNEYGAVGTVALDEQSTTYELTSAIGITKDDYYENMSALFTADIASKGVVFINIDGIGDVVLDDGDEDFIANNLYPGQLILAKFNGTKFIKHRFATTNPPAPPFDPDEPVPPENQVQVIVGASEAIKSVVEAIEILIEEFGEDGGNREATILLRAGALGNKNSTRYSVKHDLSWITIKTDGTFVINSSNTYTQTFLEYQNNVDFGEAPTITGDYVIDTFHIMVRGGSRFYGKFKDCNVTLSNPTLGNEDYCMYSPNDSGEASGKITYDNVNYSGARLPFLLGREGFGTVKIKNSIFDGMQNYMFGRNGGEMFITDSTINFNHQSVNPGLTVAYGSKLTAINSNITSAQSRALGCSLSAQMFLTNCRVAGAPTKNSMYAQQGGLVFIDGGDFRNTSTVSEPSNILADGVGSIIRLQNSPVGGTSTSNSGQVITV